MASTVRASVNGVIPTTSRRLAAYDSTGRLWVAVYSNGDSRIEFWYSDDGSTFTEATSLRITSVTSNPLYAAFDIDTTVDRAVFNGTYVVTGITSSSTWTTLSSLFPSYSPHVRNGEVVTFVKPGSSNYYVATHGVDQSGSNYTPTVTIAECTSAHAIVGVSTFTGTTSTSQPGSNCTIDFRHTGDGSTVASSSPDLFTAYVYDNTDTVYFRKLSWTGSGWSANSTRTMGTIQAWGGGFTHLSAAFDGTRYCMAWVNSSDSAEIDFMERDAGDTTTTDRSSAVPSLSGGGIQALAVSYDGSGDAVLHASGATADDVHRTQFVRSGASWDSWSTLETTTVVPAGFTSSKAWASGKGIAVVWPISASTYDYVATVDFVNTAPTAPTWESPADNSGQDRGAALTLDWAFNDPDTGDSQSAYALQRVVNGGSVEWWSVAGGTWTTETKNTSTTSSLTLSSGWATDGDSVVYKVKTYDAADVVSPLSAGLTITASVPVTPTLDAPATSATITVAQPTVSWTVAEQTAYRVRVLTSGDVELYSTGKIADTSTRSITLGYVLANGLTGLKFELTTWNNEDLAASDTNTGIDVSYTEPATPVLTVTANDAGGYITVAIADPTPAGSQPTVSYHDIYVRVASGGRQDGERTVNDDGIRISTGTVPEDGTFIDYAAASGVDYEYRSRAVGDNGTSTYSAWT